LASVLDLGSRRWLGYSMADHMRTELVADALDMAVTNRAGQVKGVIFHGDRGSQYMSGDYRKQVVGHGMVQSVGRTGVCWDNAVAEAAWSSLKRELVHRYRFNTRAEARRAIFGWINRYNLRRRSLGVPELSRVVAWRRRLTGCATGIRACGARGCYAWRPWWGAGVDGERLVFGDVG